MRILVVCDECDEEYRLDERRIGQVLPCKECGADMEVSDRRGGRGGGARPRSRHDERRGGGRPQRGRSQGGRPRGRAPQLTEKQETMARLVGILIAGLGGILAFVAAVSAGSVVGGVLGAGVMGSIGGGVTAAMSDRNFLMGALVGPVFAQKLPRLSE